SRMNFRLLSREAIVNNRRLSIVAADPATRALAASAGLPVFASVAEYETAGTGEGPGGNGASAAGGGGAAAGAGGAAVGLAASETVVLPPGERPATPLSIPATEPETAPPPVRKRSRKADQPPSEDTEAIQLPLVPPGGRVGPVASGAASSAAGGAGSAAAGGAAAAVGAAAAGTGAGAGTAAAEGAARSSGTGTAPGAASTRVGAPVRPSDESSASRSTSRVTSAPPARGLPRIGDLSLPTIGTPALVAAAAGVLLLLVAGVAAYVFLPAAEITVTPRSEEIGPISLVVRADPEATGVDADEAVVPAQRLEVPVEVSQTFTTAGRRVEEAAASGEVTFSNLDFTSANTVPAGSIVSTQSGVRFRTNGAVTVDRARLVGLQIVPTEADVGVTAVAPGPAGNVEPNTILTIPADEDPLTLKVRNRAATSGGSREEFPQIAQADIDAALEALRPQLDEAFAAAVDGGAGAAQGATPFPETAVLGEPAPTVDPATLLGQEVETFDLGLRATGTVIAVDDSPVEAIAETRLLSNVGADHRLVEGSIDIDQGEPTVTGGEVSFPVQARAERVRLLDPADLLARIKGRTVEEAESILAAFGRVDIRTWPDWVTTIPGLESRVTIVITGQGGPAGDDRSAEPSATGSPERSATPAATPSEATASSAPPAASGSAP
ncbi:MAG TPA: baseplate J/gp47 family protein, partial [Candidatus Limnocylindrales bacterium]|nr:baseplate J/gp47 family protein [Candidatus Limnocylindrales bacterium]